MTDQYAVIGHPVSHSKSPWIHRHFARQTGEDLDYTRLESAPDRFRETAGAFFSQGGAGLNVTVPFKEDAHQMAEELSERAQLAGAVNTLYPDRQGRLRGDTTDGVGLVTDLCQNHDIEVRGRRLLVLGAGGAVRGVLGPLLECQPAELVIANRTRSKAEDLATLFGSRGSVTASGFADLDGAFDLIINGTSASLAGDLPPLPDSAVASTTVCYDMMYGPEITVFNRWGQAHGAARTLDGLGMLVEQAAESFWLWRGVRPATDTVIEALRGTR